ncbi:MAG: hypothetical protein IT561_21255 [Alphaproteobacteria bacterium]|nr:hypothetical protein [Alphaproteobacteria bacterium]
MRPCTVGIAAVLAVLASSTAIAQPVPRRAHDAALDTAARILAEGTPVGRGAPTAAGALAAGPAGSYAAAGGGEGGVAATFLTNGIEVVKSRLRLPRGATAALTAFDVLDGGISLQRTAAGLIEAQAMSAVYSGTQAAALWIAAAAVSGGAGAAGVAAGATTAASTAAVGAVTPGSGIAAAAASGGWVGAVAAGAAGLAAAAFTTAVSYGYRLYDDAAARSARMAGLLQGATRSLATPVE